MVYYNENDPKTVQWLQALIREGVIADGIVDNRSIEDVDIEDLEGFTQCHFFAGIGGWSYALRLAEWPDDHPVWTGSCPCQPFSSAGKQGGFADARHLWPAWFLLIDAWKPPVLFGEQVASKPGLTWFDLVSANLENTGYAVGAADLCAAGAGAPHIRQRLYFVADADSERRERRERERLLLQRRQSREDQPETAECGEIGELAESEGEQHDGGGSTRRRRGESSNSGRVGDTNHQGPQGRRIGRNRANQRAVGSHGVAGFWDACDWIPCQDGKTRPVEPGTFPLAHGVPARVGRLRGYGNAIVPQVAAMFIKAFTETT